MKRIIAALIAILILIFSLSASAYAADINFNDVKTNDWFYKNLRELAEKNITSGYPDGTFKPGNTLKFEEFIKMIIVAVSDEIIEQKEGQDWYQPYIDKAIENKYIAEQQKSFVGQNIDRQSMAEILYHVLTEKENIAVYTDAELQYLSDRLTDINKADVKTLTINGIGIISGYPDRTFKPTNTLTRAEAVAVISRVANSEMRSPVRIILPDENGIIDTKDFESIPIEQTDYEMLKMHVSKDLRGNERYKVENLIKAETMLCPLKFGNIVITEIGILKAENSPYYGHNWPVIGKSMNTYDAIILNTYAVNSNSDFDLPEFSTYSLKLVFVYKSGQTESMPQLYVTNNSSMFENIKEMFPDYAFGEYPRVPTNKQFTLMYLNEEFENLEKIILMETSWNSSNYDVLEINIKDLREIK